MSITLTLKNIPDHVYERLKWSAQMHRRSLNNEAIVCLETVLAPAGLPVAERLARARALRTALGDTPHFDPARTPPLPRHCLNAIRTGAPRCCGAASGATSWPVTCGAAP